MSIVTPENKAKIASAAKVVAGAVAVIGAGYSVYQAVTGPEGNAYANFLGSAFDGATGHVAAGAALGGLFGLVSPVKTTDGKELSTIHSIAMMTSLGAVAGAGIGAVANVQDLIFVGDNIGA